MSAQNRALPAWDDHCCGDYTPQRRAFGARFWHWHVKLSTFTTQTLIQSQLNMRITVDGDLADGVTAKDVILAVIAK